MQARSTSSQHELLGKLDELLAGGTEASDLGSELFAVVGMFDAEPTLRRVLTEPSVAVRARSGMVSTLLDGKVSDSAVQVVLAAVSQRWSRSRDLVDALERCAVVAEATKAERSGNLDALEDDLFRFGRILEANPELRDVLSNRAAPLAARRRVLDSLLEGKVSPATSDLLGQLLVGRHHSLAAGLAYYQEVAASRRSRLVATVWVAAPLSGSQRERLASSLAKQYAHDVHLNVVVDPGVMGGVRVAIGDDVIDSTISNRVAQAHRRVAR